MLELATFNPVPVYVKISTLRRRDRREQGSVGLDVEERRSIEAIQSSHKQNPIFQADIGCD